MDTARIYIKTDTIKKSKDTLGLKIIETNRSEKITIKDSNNTIRSYDVIGMIAWPLTCLLIALLFRKPISNFLSTISRRIKDGANVKITSSGLEVSTPMNEQELKEKAKEEFEETLATSRGEENSGMKQEEFVPKYIDIERRLFEVLLNILYPTYSILSNRRIKGTEFDLIIESLQKEYDCIAEVKYFPKRIDKSSVLSAKHRLNMNKTIYERATNRKAMRILFIVYGDQVDVKDQSHIFEQINPADSVQNVKYIAIKESEIEQLDRVTILNLVNFF